MTARIARPIALFALLGALWIGLIPRAGAQTPSVIINEVLVGNASTNLDPQFTNYSAWVELRNTTSHAISLSGYRLESLPDGATTADVFPLSGGLSVPANGTLLLWADEEATGAHAPYELDMDGGTLRLLGPGNSLVDSVLLSAQAPDVSYGRAPDAGAAWAYYDRPTPGAANTTPAVATLAFAAAPTFSLAGGPYPTTRAVALATTTPGGVIRYTLDGSKPVATSPVYTTPLTIAAPTAVRARTFANGQLTSPTASRTYLIGVSGNLPLVSLATDPAHLFDDGIGIYVEGRHGLLACGKVANWNQPWERPASLEMYDAAGAPMAAQDIGIEIHGNCTRGLKQKSLELKARKAYGDNDIDYALFVDKPMTSYRRLILRTGGQDTQNSLLRDALGSQLLSGRMDIDRQAYRPVLVYINGRFWGVYALREKMDEDYVENNYGLKEETDFDMLDENLRPMAGSAARWNEFYSYLASHSPALPAVYDYIQTQMDVTEFIDYQIAEIYSANTDWPRNNVRVWRGVAPGSRWRWMLYDLDTGFANSASSGHNTLRKALAATGPEAYEALILRKLWENPDFRALFSQRFAVHLNTTYAPERVTGQVNSLSTAIQPAMAAQIKRWGLPKSLSHWQAEIAKLRKFATARPNVVRGHLDSQLGAPGTADLTVNVQGGGGVAVAGVPVPGGYRGLHFRRLPILLTATAAPGQQFVRWQETGETTATIALTLTGAATRTAVFAAAPPPPPLPDIRISEIHYHPRPEDPDEPNKEFIELYHAGSAAANLTGYTIPAISYTFPAGASIDPGEYIVVVANGGDPLFAALDATGVFDWAWTSDDATKLSNSGETVALLHPDGRVVDAVAYTDDPPWPTTPDTDDLTLALRDVALDNSDPANWAASRQVDGTPGAANFPPLPPPPAVVFNEIHYNPDDAQGTDADYEFIELLNPGAATADLSGFTLEGLTYTFPAGTTLAAGQFLVLAANAATYPGAFQWAAGDLDDGGERLALADAFGQPVDDVTYGDTGDWPAAPDGAGPSLALGDAALDNGLPAAWAASDLAGGTPGAANWPALPLVVSEVHYKVNETLQPGGDDAWEFFEVINAGDRAFDLSGYTTVGVTMTFPTGATIAAGETVLVANNAASYTAAGCPVFEWASGGLSSSGETLAFKNRFGATVLSFAFGTAAPWPAAPNGGGPTLALLQPALNNADPLNWAASSQTGGTPCQVNFP